MAAWLFNANFADNEKQKPITPRDVMAHVEALKEEPYQPRPSRKATSANAAERLRAWGMSLIKR